MATPVISDYFGDFAEVVEVETTVNATPEDPALIIRFSDFSSVGLADPSSFTDPDRVLAAIVKRTKGFTDEDTAEDAGVEVANPTKAFSIRKDATVISVAYDLAFFVPDSTGDGINPDLVL